MILVSAVLRREVLPVRTLVERLSNSPLFVTLHTLPLSAQSWRKSIVEARFQRRDTPHPRRSPVDSTAGQKCSNQSTGGTKTPDESQHGLVHSRGPNDSGRCGPKMATIGTPKRFARCIGPLSLHRRRRHCESTARKRRKLTLTA